MIPIFLAVDTADYDAASDLLKKVGDRVDVKLGLEFFIANGLDACARIRDVGTTRQRRLFLDLKLHDIPATVASAVKAAARIEPDFITLHAGDNIDSMKAAVDAAYTFSTRPKLLAVTVLTSVKDTIMGSRVATYVLNRASMARQAGMDGLVCSPHEVSQLCSTHPDMYRMVPGIRSKFSETHDQHRVATAREAMEAGANGLVIGRDIRDASDPAEAAQNILDSLR